MTKNNRKHPEIIQKSGKLIADVTRSVYTSGPNYKNHGIYFILSIIVFIIDPRTGTITKENYSSSSINWKEEDFERTVPHEKLIDKLVELTIEKKFTASSLLGVGWKTAEKSFIREDIDISDLYKPLK